MCVQLAVSDDGGRVLSIQSHVVQGYVSNKSAVFPLQLLGMDVNPINSVQFSNHTGYAKFTGRRLTGDELLELLDGITYCGTRTCTLYLYRSKVLPICDVLTPNQYECELLTEMELRMVKDATRACKKLRTLGPKVVVISSFQEDSEGETPKELVVIGSVEMVVDKRDSIRAY
ncbi:hypothetical protein PF005_g21642 [Phytophthora fragariae]|uniref:pyridoxal kinase n=1 Tax=Phytophthora fragariae TaxID=53985 RepID=A0A6A3E643_9STRA|nr:hypothetical protein PF009_g21974 [Phytophthora fragariae]KAE9184521.1 hypothetical protein PF005_g21642 [Phytophthora fragariae]